MPVLQGFGRGDHRVLVNVAVPRRLTDEQRRLLEEFERRATSETYRHGRGVLRQAEERVPLTAPRVAVTVAARARPRSARAIMLELAPEGFEEVERADGVELAAYSDAAGRSGCWRGVRRRAGREVEAGWEDAGASSTGRCAIGPLWIGPPWETPPPTRSRSSIDPGRAFGTGAHPTTRLCLELLLDARAREPARRRLRLGRALDRGGAARLRAGRRASTSTRSRSRRRARTRRRTASRSTRARRRGRRRRCPRPTSRVANIALELGRGARRARSTAHALVTSGYLVAETPALPGYAHVRAARARRLGGRRLARRERSKIPRRWRPSPSTSSAARSRTSTRTGSASGCSPTDTREDAGRRRRRRDQHLLRHERGGREEPQGRGPRGAHARARLRDRLRREPRAATRSRACRRTSSSSRGASEETAGVRRRRRRRDRLRPGRRAARPRARVREDPGRLLVLVQLLRDPARARRLAQPRAPTPCSPRCAAASSRATARSCSPGSTSAASATARPATTCRASSARRARRPGSRRLRLSARSRSTT